MSLQTENNKIYEKSSIEITEAQMQARHASLVAQKVAIQAKIDECEAKCAAVGYTL